VSAPRPQLASPQLASLQRALVDAEQKIALVESLTPSNYARELHRLEASFEQGAPCLPAFDYKRAAAAAQDATLSPTLSAAQLALNDVALLDHPVGAAFAPLLRDRVDELALELRMVLARGTPDVLEQSRTRFSFDADEREAAQALAIAWLEMPDESVDQGEPIELAGWLSSRARERGQASWGMRVVERDLASRAAIGGDCLYVRRGEIATEAVCRRLWEHEAKGHLLPRLRARTEPAPCEIGTPGTVEDEEGRAILLEERAGVLFPERRRELALRFIVADEMRQRGDRAALEKCQGLLQDGHPPRLLASILCRVARGGGMCREVVYLPSYLRVKQAVAETPENERFFERGRASVRALPVWARCFP
jgi:hypothetical protein